MQSFNQKLNMLLKNKMFLGIERNPDNLNEWYFKIVAKSFLTNNLENGIDWTLKELGYKKEEKMSLSDYLNKHGWYSGTCRRIEKIYLELGKNGIRGYARNETKNIEEPSGHTYEDEILTYIREWEKYEGNYS